MLLVALIGFLAIGRFSLTQTLHLFYCCSARATSLIIPQLSLFPSHTTWLPPILRSHPPITAVLYFPVLLQLLPGPQKYVPSQHPSRSYTEIQHQLEGTLLRRRSARLDPMTKCIPRKQISLLMEVVCCLLQRAHRRILGIRTGHHYDRYRWDWILRRGPLLLGGNSDKRCLDICTLVFRRSRTWRWLVEEIGVGSVSSTHGWIIF